MYDFMKTILLAFKMWVNERIKSNIPDWNQNDSEADGYIQNRPFYTDENDQVVKLDKKYLPDLGLATVATSGSYTDLEDTPTVYTDVVRYGVSQSLTTEQKTQARSNIGAVSSDEVTGVVKYSEPQELTEEEKAQARTNIGSDEAKDYIAFIDQVNEYAYIVSMRDGNLVSTIGVKAIEITTMPTTTEYMHGEYFDATGMIVIATCYDGTTKEIENYDYSTNYFVEGDTSIEITYTEAGVVHTAIVPVTVSVFDPAVVLIDFTYTDNGDGTYTITGWKGTYNGEASTEMIVPNYGCIII